MEDLQGVVDLISILLKGCELRLTTNSGYERNITDQTRKKRERSVCLVLAILIVSLITQ